MKKYLRYLHYILRHKYYVMIECFRRKMFWRGITHDLSKFLPCEFFPYAEYFYGKYSDYMVKKYGGEFSANDMYNMQTIQENFNLAWLHHQELNPHHWQYWILREDSGATIAIRMPVEYVMEMICDWIGAGRAITGKSGGTKEWYGQMKERIILEQYTRSLVEYEIARIK